MPFPLAHPAAVLPLRRFCPGWFSFAGLVIGSITPDAGYAFRFLDFQTFSHSLMGSVAFCLPVGLAGLALLYLVREPLAGSLPAPHRQVLLPIARQPRPPWRRLMFSLLVGAWTHIAFDGVTHESALHLGEADALQPAVTTVFSSTGLKFYPILWLAVSAGCLGIMALSYARFVRRTAGAQPWMDWSDRKRILLWLMVLVGPYLAVAPFAYHVFGPRGIQINKHTVYGSFQPYLILVTGTIVVLGLILRTRRSCPQSAPSPGHSSDESLPLPPSV